MPTPPTRLPPNPSSRVTFPMKLLAQIPTTPCRAKPNYWKEIHTHDSPLHLSFRLQTPRDRDPYSRPLQSAVAVLQPPPPPPSSPSPPAAASPAATHLQGDLRPEIVPPTQADTPPSQGCLPLTQRGEKGQPRTSARQHRIPRPRRRGSFSGLAAPHRRLG